MKKNVLSFWVNMSVIIVLFLVANEGLGNSIISKPGGNRNWSSTSTWALGVVPTKDDNVTINDSVNLDANWGPQNSGSIIFNANSSGAGTLNMSGGTIDIRANVTLTGSGINLNGGTIHVYSGYTLTMPGFSEANTNIIVDAGATIIINGNLLNNKGTIQTDGLITITGQYNGQANNALVTGIGNITTVGSMQGINDSKIFDTKNPYCPSNCDGRNLFGGGNCNGTATATPNTTSVCSGMLISFTSTLTGGYTNGNSLAYQWQVKNSAGFFENISGATTSFYSTFPTTSQTYRVVIGEKQTPSDPYCYKYSPTILITVSPCIKKWVGGTVGATNDWFTATNWSPASVPTSTDNIVIETSAYYPVIVAGTTVAAGDVTINNGCSLTSSANSVFNLSGNINNTGTWTSESSSTLNLVGSVTQTITGVSTVSNLGINNAVGVSISSPMTVNGTISLQSGVLTTNSNLAINFDKGGNIGYNVSDAGSVSGTITGQRVVGLSTHYIAAPFAGVTSAQVAANTSLWVSPYWKMYSNNFTQQNWTAVTNTTTAMPLGSGFTISYVAAAPLIFTGTYDHTFEYTSPSYSNAAGNKFFMIGNPYPSTIDWDNAAGWNKTNVANAIYFWDSGHTRSSSYVRGLGVNGATQYIPAMQAVMVSTTGAGGGASFLSINNKARLPQNATYFRVGQDDIIRLTLSSVADSTYNDEAAIRFNQEATDNFDFDFDAHKIMNMGSMPSVYTSSKNETYSINSFESVARTPYVAVATKLPSDGDYKLKIVGNNPNIDYILVDKQLGIHTNIVTDSVYRFSGQKSDDVNRFELQLRESAVTITTGLQSANVARGLQINSSVKGFILQTDRFVGAMANIELIDMTGKVVGSIPNQNIASNTTFVPVDLKEGSYIVKVTIDSQLYTGLIVSMK